MKAGRNDPCPCGSGKKYKKCCLAKDQEASSRQAAVHSAPPSSVRTTSPQLPGLHLRRPREHLAPCPATIPSPREAESLWREFESQNGEGRIAVFLKTLEDAEVMTDDLAFEMLNILHEDAVKSGDRTRFAECVGALRERRPEVFDEGGHYYLSWSLLDALAEGRQEVVPSLARELAARAGRDIDIFNRAVDDLAISRPA